MKYSKISFDFGAKFEFFSNKKIREIHHFRGFIYFPVSDPSFGACSFRWREFRHVVSMVAATTFDGRSIRGHCPRVSIA